MLELALRWRSKAVRGQVECRRAVILMSAPSVFVVFVQGIWNVEERTLLESVVAMGKIERETCLTGLNVLMLGITSSPRLWEGVRESVSRRGGKAYRQQHQKATHAIAKTEMSKELDRSRPSRSCVKASSVTGGRQTRLEEGGTSRDNPRRM